MKAIITLQNYQVASLDPLCDNLQIWFNWLTFDDKEEAYKWILKNCQMWHQNRVYRVFPLKPEMVLVAQDHHLALNAVSKKDLDCLAGGGSIIINLPDKVFNRK